MYVNELVFFCCLLLFLYFAYGAAEDKVDSKESCLSRIPSCQKKEGHKPVCGTNGRTYPSRCQLLKSRCSGEAVSVAHKGTCLDGQSCHIALQYAMSASQGSRKATFIPRCRPDGTYAGVQCAGASGGAAGCWCVTPDGKPLPDTAVRNGRPDCTRTGKSHTKRRSSARGQRNKKSCTRLDRIQFNQNLIKIFSGEYDMAKESESAPEPRAIAEWKFKRLDKDRSGALQKPEYRGLRRLIKKVVKPKRCARAWAKGCDADGDGSIARAEWLACLLASPDPPEHDYEERAPAPDRDYEDEPPPVDASAVYGGTLMRQSFAPDGADPDADGRRDDETNDCHTDRQAVLDEQKIGGAALYVPECTGDGRYARAQCYRTTPYCWCVHQDTGKPIPGSSVKDRRPDCDAAPQHSSPMRGCPEPMKSNFLRDLMQLFLTKMTSATNGTGPGHSEMVKWGASREEQTATWTFVMLDKDKNKVLERREWRAFHQLINRTEQLKRCGKKLPRYCDVNHDSGISITEWLACLEVAQGSQPVTTEATKAPTNNRRKGPNPLESFLKADD